LKIITRFTCVCAFFDVPLQHYNHLSYDKIEKNATIDVASMAKKSSHVAHFGWYHHWCCIGAYTTRSWGNIDLG
jgi:hypothetical protein